MEIKTYGYNTYEMAKNLTRDQLVQLMNNIKDDVKNHNTSGGLYLYTAPARKKLDNIAWAITHQLAA